MQNGGSMRVPRPRTRLAAMALLVTVAILLSARLAWLAVASADRHRTVAEHTIRDYADFAAFNLATAVYRDFGLQVLAAFNAMPAWNTPEAFATAGRPNGCADGTRYFEYVPASGQFRRSDGAIAEAAVTRLRDTLVHSASLLDEADWRFRLIRLDLGDAGSGVFITSTSLPGGFGVRGFTSCLWRDSSFLALMRHDPALPVSLVGDLDPDSLYAVSVGDAHGTELYVSPVWRPPTFVGSSRLGPEFGDLTLEVRLNPDLVEQLVIGGVPPSRVAGTLGLFALSTLLLVGAIMQMRREYRLIAARSDFVSGVSHELRTPLSQILIFTDLLKLDRLRSEEERGRSLDIIDKETRRLIRLVENVLQFSGAPAASEPIDDALEVFPVIRDTVEAFRPLADARDVVIELEVSRDVTVKANRNALRQVMLNLLDNAVKYGPAGQTVRIECLGRGRDVELAIEDQGPGIPIRERGRIWDGFQRLEREVRSPVSGSGIGLSVVKSLVERMQGGVGVTDSSTGGARFFVTLPAGIGSVAA